MRRKFVINLIELYEILNEKTECINKAIDILKGTTHDCLLSEEYDWIYHHFIEPEDSTNVSIPDLFAERRIEELIELLKDDCGLND